METIPGSGNWRLTLRREAEGVTILRAATCDRRAVLPDGPPEHGGQDTDSHGQRRQEASFYHSSLR